MRALLSNLAVALFVGLFLALRALAIPAEGGWVQLALAGEIVLALALYGVVLARVMQGRKDDAGCTSTCGEQEEGER
jgi:hypothetical protein